MHPELATVFALFARKLPNTPIAIHGSAVRDYANARDIDVLFLANADFPWIVGLFHTKYSGWNVVPTGEPGIHRPLKRGETAPAQDITHLRRTIYPIELEGVEKPVQLSQSSAVHTWTDHPHALLLPSGRVLNEGVYYGKYER